LLCLRPSGKDLTTPETPLALRRLGGDVDSTPVVLPIVPGYFEFSESSPEASPTHGAKTPDRRDDPSPLTINTPGSSIAAPITIQPAHAPADSLEEHTTPTTLLAEPLPEPDSARSFPQSLIPVRSSQPTPRAPPSVSSLSSISASEDEAEQPLHARTKRSDSRTNTRRQRTEMVPTSGPANVTARGKERATIARQPMRGAPGRPGLPKPPNVLETQSPAPGASQYDESNFSG